MILKRRVVITGMGAVTPIGNDIPSFAQSLQKAVSGEGPIISFDAKNFPVKRVFEVKDFNPHRLGTHLLDPFIQFAVAAADEAIRESNLNFDEVDPYKIGISVSSSKGGMHTLDRFKERFLKHPSAILGARIYANTVPNFAAQWIARRWKVKGPAKCYVAACATGTTAIIEGARMVSEGVVDYCIAGASDASIVPVLLAGYKNMKALAKDSIRPFDKRRNGFLIGEGAGIVFLESYESAQVRKTKIFGEILGTAYGNDSHDPLHFDANGDALERALRNLLKNSRFNPENVDYVNLHGTGTVLGDVYETAQIKKAFGKRAYEISMSSIKAATGHMLGASGAVGIISSLLAMNHGFIPPTLGLQQPDRACDLDYVPLKTRKANLKKTVSISMGFGGHIATIALGKV